MSSYQERQQRNDYSRNRAKHHNEPWEDYETDLLLLWDRTEGMLSEVSELLGRTIEACRQRYYVAIRQPQIRMTVTKVEIEIPLCPDCWIFHNGECP